MPFKRQQNIFKQKKLTLWNLCLLKYQDPTGKISSVVLFTGHLIESWWLCVKTQWPVSENLQKEQNMFYYGWFNLDLINFQHHQNTCEFLDGLHLNTFFPMITCPSRITSHTATLPDNIFANKFFDHLRSGLLITDISDHLHFFSIHSNNDSSNSHAHDPVVIWDNNN